MGLLERDSKTTGRSMNTNRYMFVPPVRFCSRTKYPSLTIVAIEAVAVFLATLLLSASFAIDIQNVLLCWSFTLSAIDR